MLASSKIMPKTLSKQPLTFPNVYKSFKNKKKNTTTISITINKYNNCVNCNTNKLFQKVNKSPKAKLYSSKFINDSVQAITNKVQNKIKIIKPNILFCNNNISSSHLQKYSIQQLLTDDIKLNKSQHCAFVIPSNQSSKTMIPILNKIKQLQIPCYCLVYYIDQYQKKYNAQKKWLNQYLLSKDIKGITYQMLQYKSKKVLWTPLIIYYPFIW